MTGELRRIARRVIVLGATVAVLGIAVGTVKVAADWRAADAPLDVAPMSMEAIDAQLAAESERSSMLSDDIGSVSSQVASLQAALLEAGDHMAGDTQTAENLQAQLKAAKAKLETLQAQLKAAQSRLAALNRAAARQAAANSGGSTSGSAPREPDDD
jgi:chromosome segregation ATPase